MLVRASVHVAGLRPGQSAEVNGNDKHVRAALNAGYLVRVDEVHDDPPAFDVTKTDEDPEVGADLDAEGDESQDD